MIAHREGIIWIASYPKSGNTWVRCLISSLIAGGRDPNLDQLGPNCASRRWLEQVLDVPTEDLTTEELLPLRAAAHREWVAAGRSPRHLKVHDHHDAGVFPADATAGVVYIVRDPRDVAPSLAIQMDVSIDTAIARMARSRFVTNADTSRFGLHTQQVLGSWSEHAASWLEQSPSPVLLVRYERLLADPVGESARLVAFLGLDADRETIERATAACAFDTLQDLEANRGFKEKPHHMERFFRQGQAGAWQTTLSEEQSTRIVADHHVVMAKLGYTVAPIVDPALQDSQSPSCPINTLPSSSTFANEIDFG